MKRNRQATLHHLINVRERVESAMAKCDSGDEKEILSLIKVAESDLTFAYMALRNVREMTRVKFDTN